MNRMLKFLVLPLLVALVGCGGSGGGLIDDPEKSLIAGFVPDQANPGTKTIAGSEGATVGDQVTVEINVTQTSGIYGVAFDLTFDPNMASYEGWSPGELLEQGGHTPVYQVSSPSPGQLVVVISRQGLVSGANAGVTPQTVIQLAFQVTELGSNVVAFASASVLDDQLQPQPISGMTWEGGSLVGIE